MCVCVCVCVYRALDTSSLLSPTYTTHKIPSTGLQDTQDDKSHDYHMSCTCACCCLCVCDLAYWYVLCVCDGLHFLSVANFDLRYPESTAKMSPICITWSGEGGRQSIKWSCDCHVSHLTLLSAPPILRQSRQGTFFSPTEHVLQSQRPLGMVATP